MKREIYERLRDHRFESLGEVDGYLSTPRIECLVCGEWFKLLGRHLKCAHGIDRKEYRLALNIPSNRILSCPTTRENMHLAQQTPEQIARMRDPKIRKLAEVKNNRVPKQIVEMTKNIKAEQARREGAKWNQRKTLRQIADAYNCIYGIKD